MPLDNVFGTFVDTFNAPPSPAMDDEDTKDVEKTAADDKVPPNASGIYTMEEVKRHTTKADCWVVINGRVLDVTSFMPVHPGGENVLFGFAGKDATTMFNSIHP